MVCGLWLWRKPPSTGLHGARARLASNSLTEAACIPL